METNTQEIAKGCFIEYFKGYVHFNIYAHINFMKLNDPELNELYTIKCFIYIKLLVILRNMMPIVFITIKY